MIKQVGKHSTKTCTNFHTETNRIKGVIIIVCAGHTDIRKGIDGLLLI